MSSSYNGVPPSLQDRRAEYRYLNTIMEEAAGEASPLATRPSQAILPATLQQQQQQQLKLQQQWQHDDEARNGPTRRHDPEQKIEKWLSPMSDHFPTPRGFHFLSAPVYPSSPSSASSADPYADLHDDQSSPYTNTSSPSSSWNHHNSISTATDLDDIYDASDNESSARKPTLPASSLVRRASVARHHRPGSGNATPPAVRKTLPQLTIPAASSAMSMASHDQTKLCTSPMAPTPSAQVTMSPAMMSFMHHHQALTVPSAPPSLDGSLTSEQMSQLSAQLSAPPTPIIGCNDDDDTAGGDTWAGVQLQPDALATLQALARSDAGSIADGHEPERVIEFHAAAATTSQRPVQETATVARVATTVAAAAETMEMAEMAESQTRQSLRLVTAGIAAHNSLPMPFSPAQQRSLAGLTRLEIPSPGGFFSGLSPRTRHTWHLPTPLDSAPPPTSGTAEQFYRLPWTDVPPPPPLPEQRPLHMPSTELSSSPVEQVIEVAATPESGEPMTAFRIQKTPLTAQHRPMIVEPVEHDANETNSRTSNVEVAVVERAVSVPELAPAPAPTESAADEVVVATEIVDDYLAIDAQKMQLAALAQFDRTEMWLVAQRAYLNGIADMTEAPEDVVSASVLAVEEPPAVPPKDKEQPQPAAAVSSSSGSSSSSNTKVLARKTVHFSEALASPGAPRTLPSKLLHLESAYYRAFSMQQVRAHGADAFVNRMPRFEALQAQRLLLRETHRNQLLGKYQLTVVPQSAKKRMSTNVVRGDDALVDDPAKLRADKESDALRQMAPTTWHVAALKLLNGGRLITAPVHKRLARMSVAGANGGGRDRARILDLGGQATGDWAWHAAMQYPNAKVYSVTTKAIRQLSNANIRGPPNHRQVAVERLTRLPFSDDHFDLVRAAELHSILKFVGEHGEDEWETCLREILRVLKPGGHLEFSVLDADLVNAGPLGNAKSVEFGFVLQTLGYDPAPTKLFLGRLERAGFTGVRRAWTCLPVGPQPAAQRSGLPPVARDASGAAVRTADLEAMVHGTTNDAAALTGLAGSWSWERWLLRASMEKAAGELRLADTVTASPALSEADKSLDGVHAILEEGRATGAAWRMLRGYARKPRDDMGTINMMLDMRW